MTKNLSVIREVK